MAHNVKVSNDHVKSGPTVFFVRSSIRSYIDGRSLEVPGLSTRIRPDNGRWANGRGPISGEEDPSRPFLIQELQWLPQSLGSLSKTESAQEVVFSFYDGKLFRIAIDYDRYASEGMTADDFVEAISVVYGIAEKPDAAANSMNGPYGNQEEILARWQDSQYCCDLMRSSYGRSFRLVGVVKRLQLLAQIAIAEAKRLDQQEAPQKDAARMLDEKEAERTKLEKSRLVNKPNFRP